MSVRPLGCSGVCHLVMGCAAVAVLSAGTVHAAPYSTAVLADNPLGYYRMNETSGSTATDAAGTPENGVYRNGITPAAQPPDTVGPVLQQAGPRPPAFPGFESDNASAFFDGVRASDGLGFDANASDNLNIPALASLNDSAYTFEAWVYNTGFSGSNAIKGYIGGRGSGAGNAYDAVGIMGTFQPANTGKLFLFNAQTVVTGTTVLAEDTWYHIAYTRSGTNIELYVNGVSEATATNYANTYGTDDTIRAGIRPDGVFAFEGRIDELAVYNGALSDAQIDAHYDAAFVPEPSGVIGVGSVLAGLAMRRRRGRAA